MSNVDVLWRELESLELVLDNVDAKVDLTNLFPAYLKAREVLRNLNSLTALLYPAVDPDRQLPPLPVFDASERALVGKWKAYLRWEESNPLGLDQITLSKRIRVTYMKALVPMAYHTEIWYDIHTPPEVSGFNISPRFMAYNWARDTVKSEEAMDFLTSGLMINPSR